MFSIEENEESILKMIEIYSNLGEIYMKTKKYQEAKKYLELSIG